MEHLKFPVIAAVLDQAWLSLLSFGMSISLILVAPKEEFAMYILLLAPIFLIQGIQNALLISPLSTVLPVSEDLQKPLILESTVAGQIVFSITAALMGVGILLIYQIIFLGDTDMLLAIAFGAAIAGASAREAVRSIAYVQGYAQLALIADLWYGSIVLFGLVLLVFLDAICATTVLMVIGIAGLGPLIPKIYATRLPTLHPDVWKSFWACGRWALAGVLVTWVNLNAYPFIIAMAIGLAAVADISAARFFFMPVGLGVTAWSNLARPRISIWMAQGNLQAIYKLSVQSIRLGLVCLILLVIAISLFFPYAETLLGDNYLGLLPLVLMWSVFFGLMLIRSVLMATMMTTPDGYRKLHNIAWMILPISLTGLWAFSEKGTDWILGVLCTVEALQLAIIGIHVIKRWRLGMGV